MREKGNEQLQNHLFEDFLLLLLIEGVPLGPSLVDYFIVCFGYLILLEVSIKFLQ